MKAKKIKKMHVFQAILKWTLKTLWRMQGMLWNTKKKKKNQKNKIK